MEKFEVMIYYTSFCSYEVKAKNEEQAVIKARNLAIDEKAILTNLEDFKYADEAFKIEHRDGK